MEVICKNPLVPVENPELKPACKDCRFVKEFQPGQYECRAKSPVIAVDFERSVFGYWPQVRADYWCGEFKRRD